MREMERSVTMLNAKTVGEMRRAGEEWIGRKAGAMCSYADG